MKRKIIAIIMTLSLAMLVSCSSQNPDTSGGETLSESTAEEEASDTQDVDEAADAEGTEGTASYEEEEPDVPADSADVAALAASLSAETAFNSFDIYGNDCTNAIFADYDLTLVNLYTTWCPPCKAEMPELERLYQDLSDSGVNIVGFVLDAIGPDGDYDMAALDEAIVLADQLNLSYPMIVPDEGLMNGHMDVYSVPTTFFVDRGGNIIGEDVVGARAYGDWMNIINERLAML